MSTTTKTRHKTLEVDGLKIFYRRAGDPARPTVLMLHGVPSSSHMFRHVIPSLAEVADVVAPDLPGQGFSASPTVDEYDYTFENLSRVIEALLKELGIKQFYLYLNDFGTPVGYHLATRHPERVLGLIVQNGNAHEEGLGEQWEAPKAFWADPSAENRARLPEWLNFEGTRDTYIGGLPAQLRELHPPEAWHLDWERMTRPGNIEVHFKLFTDYAAHVARFPAITDYHREHQPPCLLLWGRRDPYFDFEEILGYHRTLDHVQMHVYDAGHFLLETHGQECAELIKDFIG